LPTVCTKLASLVGLADRGLRAVAARECVEVLLDRVAHSRPGARRAERVPGLPVADARGDLRDVDLPILEELHEVVLAFAHQLL
jgi:hypothetical protein